MSRYFRCIDEKKCDTCEGKFRCVNDCVTSNLEIREVNGKQTVKFKERGTCINCGHCNTVCPNGAITYENSMVCEDSFLNFLASKRTVRQYNKTQEITQRDLDDIIMAGQSAPSEKNKATVRICLVKECLKEVFEEALEVLKEQVEKAGPLHPQYKYLTELAEKKEPVFWGAEYAVLLIGKPEYVIDAAILAERMQLMAHHKEIASGYNGNLSHAINSSEILKKRLEISDKESVLVSFAMGWSELEYTGPFIGCRRKVTIK